MLADLNQLKVLAAQTPELSALGAVFNGFLGLKIFNSLEDLKDLPSSFTEYNPSMAPGQASECFAGWQAAVQQILYQPK